MKPDETVDTNSAPGRIVSAKSGPDKPSVPGGAVIVSADGSRLELVPPNRPKPAAASRAAATLSKMELPTLDDPGASLASRKLRAEAALVVCALAAFALAYWARRRR